MGKRGPKATPAKLQALRGDPAKRGKRVLQAMADPEGRGELWAPPRTLDDDGREVWGYALDHMPPGLLSGTDRDVLALWCQHVAIWRRAAECVNRDGLFVKRGREVIENPAIAVMNRQAQLIMRCCGELGFSPASRSGMVKTGTAPEFGSNAQPPAAYGQKQRTPRLTSFIEGKPDRLDS